MSIIRIIPRLDIKGPNVVKGIHAEGLRVLGSPKEFAQKYYKAGADELLYIDIVASLYQRNLDFDLLRSVSNEIFIPLTVGGGIRSLHDISNALRSGADKVAINTYAIANPNFIREAIEKFGSQCIVGFIEAKRTGNGTWEAYTDGGRERSGKNAIAWAKEMTRLGAGEILITSVDRDGTRSGFDLDLIRAITTAVNVPVIAHGGAGTKESVAEAITEGGASAVSVASAFHYDDYSIGDLKKSLGEKNISIRK